MDLSRALVLVEQKCDVPLGTLKHMCRQAEQGVFRKQAARGLLESGSTVVLVKDELNGLINEKGRQYLECYAMFLDTAIIPDAAEAERRILEHFKDKMDSIYSEGCHQLEESKRKLRAGDASVHLQGDYEAAWRGWTADVSLLVARAKKNSMKQPSIVYNFHGPNARVNNQSVDQSVNVVIATEEQLFGELRRAIDSVPEPETKKLLLADMDALQAEKNKPGRLEAYRKLIQDAANHITILTPFLPALAQWIG